MVIVGLNTADIPDTTYIFPHEPEYQFQFAAVPVFPPTIPRVVVKPLQIGEDAVAEVAGVDKEFTITVTLAQLVVLQIPAAET